MHVVGGRGKPVPFGGALVDGAKSDAAVQAGGHDLAQVGQFHAGTGRSGLSPFVFKVRHAEFVDPDLGAFVVAVVGAAGLAFLAVAHSNKHSPHQSQVGHAHHPESGSGRILGVRVGNQPIGVNLHQAIAFQFQGSKYFQRQIHVVGIRPNGIGIFDSPRGDF